MLRGPRPALTKDHRHHDLWPITETCRFASADAVGLATLEYELYTHITDPFQAVDAAIFVECLLLGFYTDTEGGVNAPPT